MPGPLPGKIGYPHAGPNGLKRLAWEPYGFFERSAMERTGKFAEEDNRYLSSRPEAARRIGRPDLFEVIDHWPLYVGVGNLGRALSVVDLVRSALSIPGHIAEFGCWRGANLMLMAKTLEIFAPHSTKMVLGFDSFEGLRTFSPEDENAALRHGHYKGDQSELELMIDLYRLNGMVRIVAGDIRETLPALVKKESSLSFSLLYCDTDLYEPTRAILDCCWERLSQGGKAVFDQWNSESYPGETRAVREFLGTLQPGQYRMEEIPFTPQPTLVVTRL